MVLDRGRDAEVWQRGRMLGGSSAVNGMIYIRGQAGDYDACLTIGAYRLRPSGEGEVTIESADPRSPPRIAPNWMVDPADAAAGARLIAFVRDLVSRPALAPLVDRELAPGATVSGEASLTDYFLREARTGNHAVATCAMGVAADAALDPHLRVRGTGPCASSTPRPCRPDLRQHERPRHGPGLARRRADPRRLGGGRTHLTAPRKPHRADRPGGRFEPSGH